MSPIQMLFPATVLPCLQISVFSCLQILISCFPILLTAFRPEDCLQILISCFSARFAIFPTKGFSRDRRFIYFQRFRLFQPVGYKRELLSRQIRVPQRFFAPRMLSYFSSQILLPYPLRYCQPQYSQHFPYQLTRLRLILRRLILFISQYKRRFL